MKLSDVIHLYLGCEVKLNSKPWTGKMVGIETGEQDALIKFGFNLTPDEDYIEDSRAYKWTKFKPILRRLSSMTEDDFKEFAKWFFKDENLLFATHDKVWYACVRVMDEEYEGEEIEFINEACDDDPENVLMCDRGKGITYGWITYDEMYHSFSMNEQAEVTAWLLSKHFDLFGLIDSQQAIENNN